MVNILLQGVEMESVLDQLDQYGLVRRIWQKDHLLWKSDPTEITNRLGWLDITEVMRKQASSIQHFVEEVREEGFHTVVLLGMGGSSLGAEVLWRVFGTSREYLNLIVLDSTVPAEVAAVAETIEPIHTLFLVSSKSGNTIETLLLFKYFKALLDSVGGKHEMGQNFVAITDTGTPLMRIAKEQNFRHVFRNPPGLGGRYSILSYFGLVPAGLIGIDIERLLERAIHMQQECGSSIPAYRNPGAWLGAAAGTMAVKGKDKLTVVTSPHIDGFGLWIEQLVAESTGKEGKGIIPVIAEPLVKPEYYGDDRLFVYLRMEDDDNSITDKAIHQLKASGQSVLTLELHDKYDLGAEFFRWEFATAVAGAILSVNPFDQPDVQKSKERTEYVLKEYTDSGCLPYERPVTSVAELLAEVKEGDYLAIMAYIRRTLEVDNTLCDLRRKVIQQYHIATTLGYGPSFLHSTGQLHKGGPNTGLFIQITVEHERDLFIPGNPYTFGVVVDAQALGDFQTLRELRRRVVRIHLAQQDDSYMRQWVRQIL
jgi:glucose-6-phosphate isomerase